MLESLRGIVLEGYTRELPVFGILQGEVVIGVIDEVVLKNEVPLIPQKRASDFSESPGKKEKKQRRARALSPSQHLLPEYLPAYVSTDPPAQHDPVALSNPVTASMEMKAVGAKSKEVGRRPSTPDEPPPPAPALPAPPPVPIEVDFPESKFKEAIRPSTLNQLLPPTPKPGPPRRYLHLVDTKTRQKKSLPSDKDTLPSRMQLMLYHRLLKEMISISPPFDFAAMWEHLGVDPTATFSTAFLVQAGLLDKDWGMPCLNALSEAFIGMVLDLDLAGIDTNLELVYRLRGSKVKFGRGKGKSKSEEGTGKKRRASPPVVTQEEHDIARAIETSLLDACASAGPTVPETSTSGSGQFEPVLNLQTPSDSETFLDPLAVQFTTGEAGTTIRPSSSRSSSVSEVDRHELTPIGTKEFQYEEETLDHHITNALRFWHGTREPQGVSIEDSWRCRTCEYENNCEWREKKAEEDQERRMQARRQC
ncbi:hypothetical protein H0H87_006418 [Tephrocybe sp. NHM501043]|nr:hypothetical protein H0H87_006418 [Tephrocybe sp. NHM501043]